MSYTMTIESPERVAWFEQRKERISPSRLGSLFVAFLMQQGDALFDADQVPASPDCRNPELLKLAGSWVEDPAMERAFEEMDKIDEGLWK